MKSSSNSYLISALFLIELQFSYQWRTTIAFYVNRKDRFIDFRFVPAPAELQFYWYNITLSRIVSHEGTSTEARHTVSSMGTNLVRSLTIAMPNLWALCFLVCTCVRSSVCLSIPLRLKFRSR